MITKETAMHIYNLYTQIEQTKETIAKLKEANDKSEKLSPDSTGIVAAGWGKYKTVELAIPESLYNPSNGISGARIYQISVKDSILVLEKHLRLLQDALEIAGNPSQTTTNDALISIVDQGVRVQALGEDFAIGLHDLDNGKDNFKYDEAMSRLKELNMATFNRKQAAITCIYLDQINDKLIEAGGDPFAEDWYTTNELYIPKEKRLSADHNAESIWYFYGSLGCLSDHPRYINYYRCRPVLSFPLPN